MEFNSLKILRRDNNETLYDISEISFTYNKVVIDRSSINYRTTEDDEMRLDLVCDKIYNDVNQIDFFCNLNNIKNPLIIKKDLDLIYVPLDSLAAFAPERSENSDKVRRIISNKRKATNIDPNRSQFLEDKSQSLPPSITKKDYNPVKYRDGKISIGGGIFRV